MKTTVMPLWICAATIATALNLAAGEWWDAAPVGSPRAGAIRLWPQGDTANVRMELPGVDGRIDLRLPELINDDSRRLVYTEANLTGGIAWQTSPEGAITGEWKREGLASYRIKAIPQRDGVLLDWVITNLSREEWTETAGNICMRSDTVPVLFDPSGNQIFLRSKGRWVSARDSGNVGSTWYLPPGRKLVGIMRPYVEGGSYRISEFRPDEAIIAVRSRDSSWVLAQAWSESRYLLANIHPRSQCCEAPPYLGDIPAGKTVRITGKLYFIRGTLDDLETAYRLDLKRGVITRHSGK